MNKRNEDKFPKKNAVVIADVPTILPINIVKFFHFSSGANASSVNT